MPRPRLPGCVAAKTMATVAASVLWLSAPLIYQRFLAPVGSPGLVRLAAVNFLLGTLAIVPGLLLLVRQQAGRAVSLGQLERMRPSPRTSTGPAPRPMSRNPSAIAAPAIARAIVAASRGVRPRASWAASTAEWVQPEPCAAPSP